MLSEVEEDRSGVPGGGVVDSVTFYVSTFGLAVRINCLKLTCQKPNHRPLRCR